MNKNGFFGQIPHQYGMTYVGNNLIGRYLNKVWNLVKVRGIEIASFLAMTGSGINLTGFGNLLGLVAIMLTVTLTTVQAQTPGGVNGAQYQWIAWLTADGFAGTVWSNNITSGGAAVGNFTAGLPATPPTLVNTGGYNFHP
ncbi:MAG: hypothetical protein LBR18_06025, partial [Tannerella sp.]|nr:hypothetical protein [Tannerella sp.]